MRHVWKLIEREMRDRNVTARELSEQLKLDPAQLSRLRTGTAQDLSAEVLSRLLRLADGSPERKSEILAAYLLDKLHPRITASIASESSSRVREAIPPYEVDKSSISDLSALPPRVQLALTELAAGARSDRRLQKLLISLAEYVRGGESE